MSAAHTPGPWVKDRYQQLIAANGKQVGVWGCGISWVSRDGEAEANARLIAAAPDLLEALQSVVSKPIGLIARRKVEAAIHKATTAVEPNLVGTPQGVNQK